MISKKIEKKCHDTGGKVEENEEKLDPVEMIYDLSTLNMGHDEHCLLFRLIFLNSRHSRQDYTLYFYKKVVYKKVVLEWPKP